MLHKFFEKGDWFSAKTLGYGAGLPIAWQGWVLLAAYLGIMFGIGLFISAGGFANLVVGITGIVLATAVFALIAKKRTRGGWKWRP
ncbi:hypothetical protein WAB17_07135 [Parerythrobacter aurantius]|uniref:hypothetical protein n=1 Tax=Parerythrobacter aurantius TaxID=3127706 RepID=UPI00324B8B21